MCTSNMLHRDSIERQIKSNPFEQLMSSSLLMECHPSPNKNKQKRMKAKRKNQRYFQ